MIIRLGKLGADTIYFTFLGRPTGIAFSLLPTLPPSTVFIKPSSPHSLPVLVLLLIVLFIPAPSQKDYFMLINVLRRLEKQLIKVVTEPSCLFPRDIFFETQGWNENFCASDVEN